MHVFGNISSIRYILQIRPRLLTFHTKCTPSMKQTMYQWYAAQTVSHKLPSPGVRRAVAKFLHMVNSLKYLIQKNMMMVHTLVRQGITLAVIQEKSL